MLHGGKSFGMARHLPRVVSTYMIPFRKFNTFARPKIKRTPRRKTLVAAFWKQAELPF